MDEDLCTQLAVYLASVHAAGVTTGDVAPDNLLVNGDMEAGLMDAPWPPVYPKMPNEAPRVQPSRAKKPE